MSVSPPVVPAPMAPTSSPSLSLRNHHAIQEAAGPSHVAINAISANMDSFARGRTAILKKQPATWRLKHFGDLGRSSVNYLASETLSRLSKTVDQILRDNVAMPYYMQFQEARGADHLVRFWLEAESFRSTSWSRVRTHSLNSVKLSSLAEPASTPVSPDPSTPTEMDLPSVPRPASARPLTPSPQDTNSHSSEGPTAQLVHRDSFSSSADQRSDTPTRQPSSSTGTPFKLQSTNALKELSDKLMKSIERDAVNIFTKYVSPDAARPIPITEQIRNDIVAKICGEDGMVDPNCFVNAQSVVFSIMEQQHFSEFLRSHHFCKYQIEVLTSGSVFLADILFCESALFYFSEYMEKEEAVNVLQFWLAADNFQDQLAAKAGQYDGQEAQNDAMILYDKYFSLQATNPLGFDDSVRMEIEQAWTTMEKVRAAVKILKNFDEAITVDIASLDPESLYQRPYAGRMTFGKVNELGQFIREAEPEPDVKKSKGSMLSLAMKKLVQGNSDEAQEEMAWKIAKMIVNDVVHQAHHDSPGKSTKVCQFPQSVCLAIGPIL
uniref:RGS domain-containing protein n=1 Tax=Esox lucius TaxID=8010 RepID=A0A6Q2Z2P1_ESOLU